MTTSTHGALREQVRVTDSALSFARAMHELDGDDFDVLYFLDRPGKWQADYELWLTRGAPTSSSDEQWDGWANVQLQRYDLHASADAKITELRMGLETIGAELAELGVVRDDVEGWSALVVDAYDEERGWAPSRRR